MTISQVTILATKKKKEMRSVLGKGKKNHKSGFKNCKKDVCKNPRKDRNSGSGHGFEPRISRLATPGVPEEFGCSDQERSVVLILPDQSCGARFMNGQVGLGYMN